jgi:hypothetical protein
MAKSSLISLGSLIFFNARERKRGIEKESGSLGTRLGRIDL